MKAIRKITINKTECAILSDFLDVCNDCLEVEDSEEICDLLNAISAKNSALYIGNELFAIEYID